MTDHTTELASTGDVQAAIDAGIDPAGPNRLDDTGRFFSVVAPAGATHHVVDLEDHLESRRETPRRKTGTFHAHTGDAFISYLEKHCLAQTEVWADLTSRSVTAVINAHDDVTSGDAGWGDHRLELKLQHTPAWQAWTKLDGAWLAQVQFAELLEERLQDVVEPDGATLTEVARTFRATKSVAFESDRVLSSGQVQLGYREEIDAKAGRAGNLDVPEKFTLGLAPFEGGKPYAVLARLRFSIDGGTLRIKYVLDRPAEVVRTAFDEVVGLIGAGVSAPLYHGRSA